MLAQWWVISLSKWSGLKNNLRAKVSLNPCTNSTHSYNGDITLGEWELLLISQTLIQLFPDDKWMPKFLFIVKVL